MKHFEKIDQIHIYAFHLLKYKNLAQEIFFFIEDYQLRIDPLIFQNWTLFF